MSEVGKMEIKFSEEIKSMLEEFTEEERNVWVNEACSLAFFRNSFENCKLRLDEIEYGVYKRKNPGKAE